MTIRAACIIVLSLLALSGWGLSELHHGKGDPGEGTTGPSTTLSDGSCGWAGAWKTTFGTMELQQVGDTVTGSYSHDEGQIMATVYRNTIIGKWSEAPSYSPPQDAGDMEFTMSEDCQSFTGRWRYGNEGDWRDWTGKRA